MNHAKFNKRLVHTWDKLKAAKTDSCQVTLRGVLFSQYHQCTQGSRIVSKYSRDFHRLSSHDNLNESEEQLIAKFVQGSRSKFEEKLIPQPQH